MGRPAAPARECVPPLWVSGKDAYLELGLSPDFRVSVGARTQIFGQITVYRARVDVLGRRFDVKADSTLTFGGAPDHPALDVRAEHENDTEHVTVLMTAKGTPDHKLRSRSPHPTGPRLAESQLYTLIITGRLQLGGGTPATSRRRGPRRRRRWSAACWRRSCSRRWRTGCRSTC